MFETSNPGNRWNVDPSPWEGLSHPCATGRCAGCKWDGCQHDCHGTEATGRVPARQ